MRAAIALDIGGTNLRVALVDEQYKIIKQTIQVTPLNNLEAFLSTIAESISPLLKNDSVDISAIACGVPGRVDLHGGIEILPNIGIRQVPLKRFLESKFLRPVIIKNDAVMAAVAEGNLGFGKHLDSSFFITISTGIGAAFIRNHQLAHSSEEMGHMLVPFANGYEELEKVASGQGIVNLARHFDVMVDDAKSFFESLNQSNPKVVTVFQEWLNYLTNFLKWIDRYYSPDAMIFTGGVMKSKNHFWKQLQEAVPHLPLALAQFGQDAGIMGAANLALSWK